MILNDHWSQVCRCKIMLKKFKMFQKVEKILVFFNFIIQSRGKCFLGIKLKSSLVIYLTCSEM